MLLIYLFLDWYWSCACTGTQSFTQILFPSVSPPLVLFFLQNSSQSIFMSSSYSLHSHERLCPGRAGMRRYDRRCTILTGGRNNYIFGICRRTKVRFTKLIRSLGEQKTFLDYVGSSFQRSLKDVPSTSRHLNMGPYIQITLFSLIGPVQHIH